jgi:NADH:ubiquinone oxidoreductase subunit C
MSLRSGLRALIEARVGHVGCVDRVANGGVDVLAVPAAALLRVCTFLRDDRDAAYDLVDITAVDHFDADAPRGAQPNADVTAAPRFVVCLILASRTHQSRARIEIDITPDSDARDGGAWPSVSSIWPAALLYEREIVDLFGLIPDGHPNPKRLVLPETFAGHPLRLDYRITKTQPQVPAPASSSRRVSLGGRPGQEPA